MSRAFVKEDVDPPERSFRKRASSGLPPGTVNYLTERGAKRLQAELTKLREHGDKPERVARLEAILSSAEVVGTADATSGEVAFGAIVQGRDQAGKIETYVVVGADELDMEPHAVSWISPLGRALLAAKLGDRITLDDGRSMKIIAIS